MRVAVLTVSTSGSLGERPDRSGDLVVAWAEGRGSVVAARALVPDRSERIVAQLLRWCDDGVADLVLTTGGTGLSPDDVTPEATRAVLDREAPGLAERIRALPQAAAPRAALSRGVAGVRHRSVIVNLPGSPAGVRDALAALEPIIGHACAIARGDAPSHEPAPEPAS